MVTASDTEVITSGPLYEAVQNGIDPRYSAFAQDESENIITEAYITEGGDAVSSVDLVQQILAHTMRGFDADRIHKEIENSPLIDVVKSAVSGSTQDLNELGMHTLSNAKVVEPPYPPELLRAFLEVDSVHYRCVKTKVTDAIGRDYTFEIAMLPNGDPYDPATISDEDKAAIAKDKQTIVNFLEECNDVVGFDGVLERAGMDHEAIGWSAMEIVRDRTMMPVGLSHIPASRVKVLRGWKGFVEQVNNGVYVYYQAFGTKVVSKNRIDPNFERPMPYNPRLDGPIATGAKWNLIDRTTGEPTTDFSNSANELLFNPKHHSSTIYYGFTDVIPAIGHLLGNVHIRDYMLQFFEHNTVPRYAVIIEGAKLHPDVMKTITQYFSENVKGKAHKTLIIPVPAMRGEVKLRFEKLAADVTEGSFLETQKSNNQGTMVAHGMSPAIIGIAEAANLGSGKGLSQAEIYKDRIVTPSQRKWATLLNNLIRNGLGIRTVKLSFTPLDIRDLKAEMDVYKGYLEVGAITINRVIERTGLGDPLLGGDRAFIILPTGIQYVDEMTDAVSTEKQVMQDNITELQNQLSVRAVNAQTAQDEAKKAGAAIKPPLPGKNKLKKQD